jgi:flagellar hook-associated protein 3 FlgL
MRITQRSMYAGVESNLQASLSRLQQLQQQMSSGKAVSRPSDSPTSAVSALRFRAEIRRGEQLQRNADDADSRLSMADRTITDQIDIVNRARNLALQGINASSGPQAREALAAEVEQLRQAAISNANATYLGRPIFAGSATGATAYDANGVYPGNGDAVMRAVAPNVTVQVNLPGTDVFGPAGNNMFTALDDIVAHLRSGDTAALGADVDSIDTVFQRLTNSVSAVGARNQQVQAMKARMDNQVLDATNGLAEVESIDLPATIVKLQMQEVAYQSALQATARMIQPSLVDFLR